MRFGPNHEEPSKVQVRSRQKELVLCAKLISFVKLANGSFDFQEEFLVKE